MSEEAKRIGAGDLIVRSPSDDRKPSTVPEKKVIIKSADMKEDVQKEAVDIAIAVSLYRAHKFCFTLIFLWKNWSIACVCVGVWEVQCGEGCGGADKEGVRQEVWAHLALYCRQKFRYEPYQPNRRLLIFPLLLRFVKLCECDKTCCLMLVSFRKC